MKKILIFIIIMLLNNIIYADKYKKYEGEFFKQKYYDDKVEIQSCILTQTQVIQFLTTNNISESDLKTIAELKNYKDNEHIYWLVRIKNISGKKIWGTITCKVMGASKDVNINTNSIKEWNNYFIPVNDFLFLHTLDILPKIIIEWKKMKIK